MKSDHKFNVETYNNGGTKKTEQKSEHLNLAAVVPISDISDIRTWHLSEMTADEWTAGSSNSFGA